MSFFQQPPEPSWAAVSEAPRNLTHVLTIPAKSEPGDRIRIYGHVMLPGGVKPAAGVILYFYHANAKGIYPKRGNEPRSSFAWWHGYLRGWLKTNRHGEYVLNSIKPAPYPEGTEPAHIHCIVKPVHAKEGYYIEDFVFKDDPYLTERYWQAVERYGGKRYKGVILSRNRQTGTLEGKRDIVLRRS